MKSRKYDKKTKPYKGNNVQLEASDIEKSKTTTAL